MFYDTMVSSNHVKHIFIIYSIPNFYLQIDFSLTSRRAVVGIE